MPSRRYRRNGRDGDRPRDLRHEMIRETNAFLSWALAQGSGMPRIPRRRVSEGGFSGLMRLPRARAAAAAFWQRTFDRLGDRGQ